MVNLASDSDVPEGREDVLMSSGDTIDHDLTLPRGRTRSFEERREALISRGEEAVTNMVHPDILAAFTALRERNIETEEALYHRILEARHSTTKIEQDLRAKLEQAMRNAEEREQQLVAEVKEANEKVEELKVDVNEAMLKADEVVQKFEAVEGTACETAAGVMGQLVSMARALSLVRAEHSAQQKARFEREGEIVALKEQLSAANQTIQNLVVGEIFRPKTLNLSLYQGERPADRACAWLEEVEQAFRERVDATLTTESTERWAAYAIGYLGGPAYDWAMRQWPVKQYDRRLGAGNSLYQYSINWEEFKTEFIRHYVGLIGITELTNKLHNLVVKLPIIEFNKQFLMLVKYTRLTLDLMRQPHCPGERTNRANILETDEAYINLYSSKLERAAEAEYSQSSFGSPITILHWNWVCKRIGYANMVPAHLPTLEEVIQYLNVKATQATEESTKLLKSKLPTVMSGGINKASPGALPRAVNTHQSIMSMSEGKSSRAPLPATINTPYNAMSTSGGGLSSGALPWKTDTLCLVRPRSASAVVSQALPWTVNSPYLSPSASAQSVSNASCPAAFNNNFFGQSSPVVLASECLPGAAYTPYNVPATHTRGPSSDILPRAPTTPNNIMPMGAGRGFSNAVSGGTNMQPPGTLRGRASSSHSQRPQSPASYRSSNGSRSRSRRGQCYYCHSPNHLISSCPMLGQKARRRRPRRH